MDIAAISRKIKSHLQIWVEPLVLIPVVPVLVPTCER